MAQLWAYPKIWALGHAQLTDLLHGPVVIQEKVDGSQFSFGNIEGKLHMRSKGQPVGAGGKGDGMFEKAARTAELIFATGTLPEGMVVRCETLSRPCHNTLAYDRVPTGNIAVFDIEQGPMGFLAPATVQEQCKLWGIEAVPLFAYDDYTADQLRYHLPKWLDTTSFLGGQKLEGVVVKNYRVLTPILQQPAFGKFVSEAFKEVHSASWKERNPGRSDKIQLLIDRYRTPARWNKSVQHARDEGVLLNEPKDIGMLIGRIKSDLLEECGDEIRQQLFKEFLDDVVKGVIRGFPEYYKQQLLEQQK